MHGVDRALPHLAGSCGPCWNHLVTAEDEWLEGWDPTPGIVSVWAEGDGLVHVWRRVGGELRHETARFRPWVLVDRVEDPPKGATWRELGGDGALRFLVRGDDLRALERLATRATASLVLASEEQYLVASGRTYFKDLPFEALRRMQIDLETTGLDPQRDRIFLVAVRTPDGETTTLENDSEDRVIAA